MTNGIQLRVIRDYAEIEEIRTIWEAWHGHPNSDIDFCTTMMRSMPGVMRPHILVLYREGTPTAMLVGRLEKGQIHLKAGYKNLMKMKARQLTFIYGGFLGETSPENAKILVQEIMGSLGRQEADAAMLSNVDIESPLYGYAQESSGIFCRDYAPRVDVHRSMSLRGSYEEVSGKLSGKVRKNLKWQAKKLDQDLHGDVRIRTFCEPAELQQMINDVEQVAKKTYQRGLGVGFVDGPEMRKRLDLEVRKGWMRAFVLYLADKPCAFWIGTLYQDVFYSGFMGYDPEYGKYSPGMFLIMRVIEDFCGTKHRDRPQEIDFGFGEAQYKLVLGDQEWRESSPFMFAPTLKGFALNLLRTPDNLLNQVATAVLARTTLLARIKRTWRDRVMQR